MQALGFFLLLPLIYFISILPSFILRGISSFACFIVFRVMRYRRTVVKINLHNAFPEKTEKEIWAITKKFYMILTDTLFESIKGLTLSHKNLMKKCAIQNYDLVHEQIVKGRNIMLVPGHYGNWEWAGGSMAVYAEMPMKAAFKPLSNKYFNWLAVKSRTRLKILLIPKRQLIKHLADHAHEQTMLVLIADQSPNPKEHYWVDFLNQDTAVVTGMEKLARQYNYVVFYATIHWIKRGKYQITYKMLTDDPNALPPQQLTSMFMEELEQDIRRNPAPYLWSHRRWKLKKPA